MDFSKVWAALLMIIIGMGSSKKEIYSKIVYLSLILTSDNNLSSHQTYFHFDFTGLRFGFEISKKILVGND